MARSKTWAQTTIVYFIECGGWVKIGHSSAGSWRIRYIQQYCPFRMRVLGEIAGGFRREQSIHKQFKHLRGIGEWFQATPELLAFIEEALLAEAA